MVVWVFMADIMRFIGATYLCILSLCTIKKDLYLLCNKLHIILFDLMLQQYVIYFQDPDVRPSFRDLGRTLNGLMDVGNYPQV